MDVTPSAWLTLEQNPLEARNVKRSRLSQDRLVSLVDETRENLEECLSMWIFGRDSGGIRLVLG